MSKEIIVAEAVLPDKLFIVPLMGKPIFPGIFTPIMITSNEDIEIINQAMETDKVIGLNLFKEEGEGNAGPEDICKVGTAAKIVKKINLPDGAVNVFISTVKRFRITKYFTSEAPLIAAVEYLDDIVDKKNPDELKALTRSVISEMKQISEDNPLFSEEMRLNMVNIDNPGKIADFITSILNIDRMQQQGILEELNIHRRMEQVLVYIKKEQELLRIQRKIANQINEKIERSQREYFLREEIKAIKKELGEPMDSKSNEYNKFKELIDKFNFEGEIKEQVEGELEKFALMDPSSSEYIVTRNYLDTIINLPWGEAVPDKIDMSKAERILHRDHYGLEDVKERILEYLAVRKLKNDSKGSIIILVGPPGVGKTSIGRSVASALGRKFFRFSVGGMRDEAEIKGHRRTYVGAMPGKIIQGLKIVKDRAPVFMIDEIDKLGQSYQGDPSSALLEVLDPEQNVAFRDHYLDLPYDLSHILFIATANTLDSIPRPLLDRMEIIRLSGYITEEKVEIARKYLIPKSLEKHGIKKEQISYNKAALRRIVDGYAREAGMRTLEKAIDKINRKVARKIVMGVEGLPIKITPEDLESYLKKPYFWEDELKKASKPGMAVGLAWTSVGGDTLIIEAIEVPGKGALQLTGKMGDVMKESASIAFSHIKQIGKKYGIQTDFFEKNNIHLHIPEGATPKDGPSAGITMATALLSLGMKKTIKKGVAMTGELSLTGKVLAIGGLKEKTIAARRNKTKEIIIPKQNERDLDEIPDHIKEGLIFHPVETLQAVLEIVFP